MVKLLSKLWWCGLAWLPVVAVAAPPAWQACPLHQAVYRDAGRQGFTLEFFKSGQPPGDAESLALASATVRHAKKGVISRWELSHGLGYGSFDLFAPTDEDQGAHGVYAFDAEFKPLDAPHGAWLFVAGLGKSDWYSGRAGARDAPLLKDPMWAFMRCKQ